MTDDAPADGPALAISVPRLGRMYRYPTDGELCPSVTNVIGTLAKPWLAGWAAKMVAADAWAKRDMLANLDEAEAVDLLKKAPYRNSAKAAQLGTTIHRYIQSLSDASVPAPELSEAEAPYVVGLQRFLADFAPEFIYTEATLFSGAEPQAERYGGTADFIAEIGGRLVLGDWKTGAGVYDEAALQLAALRYAPFLWDQAKGALIEPPAVEGCIVVHLQPETYRAHWVEAGPFAFETFRALRRAWDWTKMETSPIAEALSPASLEARLVHG